MTKFKDFIKNLLVDEEGASAIEYALIVAMVAVVVAGFMTDIKAAISSIFTAIETGLTS